MTNVTSGGTQYDGSSTFGGFVGNNNATISNCYATGNVTSSVNSRVGGFAGNNHDGGTVAKSYSTGDVKASAGNSHKVVGRSSGIIKKIYSITSSILTAGNSSVASYKSEYEEIDYNLLLSDEILKNKLSWDEEGWHIGIDSNPFLSWEVEYSHDFTETVIEPTCLKPGFTMYECKDCGKIFLMDIKEALGHEPQGEAYHVVEPTHTTAGYEMYVCKHTEVCDNEDLQYRIELEALGHDEISEISCNSTNIKYIDGVYIYTCSCDEKFEISQEYITHTPENVNYKAPTCTTYDPITNEKIEAESGITQGTICSDCNKVLFGCIEIEPHDLELKEELVEVKCTTDGLALYQCKSCEEELELPIKATGHIYDNNSFECTVCHEDQFEIDASYYPINSAEELSMLNTNPFGKYYLNANIDLTEYEFKPLCEKTPFNGILLGNGYKITNMVITKDTITSTNVAFIVNVGEDGIIAGLTFENVYITVRSNITDVNNQNSSLTIMHNVGVIVANNNGTIYRCNIIGDIDIRISTDVSNNSTKNISKPFNITYGTLAANNELTGKIVESNVKGNMYLTYSFTANLVSKSIASTVQHLLSVTKAENITDMVSGGIAGVNKGYIGNTAIESNISTAMTRISEVADRGKSSLVVNLYEGAFVGINGGEIVSSKSKKINNDYHSADYDAYVYDYPLMLKNVVIRSEYMKIKDYSLAGNYAGIIGHNSTKNLEITVG